MECLDVSDIEGLPPLGTYALDLCPKVWLHYYLPSLEKEWWVMESDGKDLLYGVVSQDGDDWLRRFRFSDIHAARDSSGLPARRDKDFMHMDIGEVYHRHDEDEDSDS